jgi:hypothetical protein
MFLWDNTPCNLLESRDLLPPLQGEYKCVPTFWRIPLHPYSGQKSKKDIDILEEPDTSIFRLYEDIEEY